MVRPWLAGIILVLIAGCTQAEERRDVPDPGALRFSGVRAFAAVETQVTFGPRPTGSVANARMRDWVVAQLEGWGWRVTRQSFTPVSGVTAENLIAVKGAGPTIMLGAHHDTRLISDEDPDSEKRDQAGPGANDGGSGVAALLELARVIDPEALDLRVCLAFFDAEDNGGIADWEWAMGSAWYVANPGQVVECDNPDAMVVLDMVGDRDQQIYRDFGSTVALQDALWTQADMLDVDGFDNTRRYSIVDDHIAFRDMGIPALVVIDFEYAHWHTTADTPDKVSADSLQTVGHVVEAWLRGGALF